MSSDFTLGPPEVWIDVARALDRQSGEPRAAITLPEALHTLRVRCEPDRVIGYRAHDSLDVLVVELGRLQAMEARARKVEAAVTEPVTAFNVRYILTGET